MIAEKPDEWMPLHIGEYLADTMHLTRDQHGAYLLLIMAYWRRGMPLPDDDGQLAAMARATPSEWRKMKPIIAAFFQIGDGVWKQKRCELELLKARQNVAIKSEAGKAGARARWQNDGNRNATANGKRNAEAYADAIAEDMRTQCPIVTSYQEPDISSSFHSEERAAQAPPPPQKQASSPPKPKEPKGSRWSADRPVPDDWLREGEMRRAEHGLPPIDLRLEAEKFTNYWASRAGMAALKVDWHLTWINWTLRSDGNGRNGNSAGGRNSGASTSHQNFLAGGLLAIEEADANRGEREQQAGRIEPGGDALPIARTGR